MNLLCHVTCYGLKMQVFGSMMMPYRLVNSYRCFGEACCLHIQGIQGLPSRWRQQAAYVKLETETARPQYVVSVDILQTITVIKVACFFQHLLA
jgi:hypothetical protein